MNMFVMHEYNLTWKDTRLFFFFPITGAAIGIFIIIVLGFFW